MSRGAAVFGFLTFKVQVGVCGDDLTWTLAATCNAPVPIYPEGLSGEPLPVSRHFLRVIHGAFDCDQEPQVAWGLAAELPPKLARARGPVFRRDWPRMGGTLSTLGTHSTLCTQSTPEYPKTKIKSKYIGKVQFRVRVHHAGAGDIVVHRY